VESAKISHIHTPPACVRSPSLSAFPIRVVDLLQMMTLHGLIITYRSVVGIKVHSFFYFIIFTFTHMCIHCVGHLLPSPHKVHSC
jgi:hypothetical protein